MILAPEVWWEAVAPWRRNRELLESRDLSPNQFAISYHQPAPSLSAIVGQYQRIGLLDARPTTWMPNCLKTEEARLADMSKERSKVELKGDIQPPPSVRGFIFCLL